MQIRTRLSVCVLKTLCVSSSFKRISLQTKDGKKMKKKEQISVCYIVPTSQFSASRSNLQKRFYFLFLIFVCFFRFQCGAGWQAGEGRNKLRVSTWRTWRGVFVSLPLLPRPTCLEGFSASLPTHPKIKVGERKEEDDNIFRRYPGIRYPNNIIDFYVDPNYIDSDSRTWGAP